MHEAPPECLIFSPNGVGTADTMASLLHQDGIHTTLAEDMAGFVALLTHGPWRLLVIDAETSLRKVQYLIARCRERCPGIPVVVLVGPGDVPTAVRAMKAGAVDCLEKPIKRESLSTTIATICNRAERDPGQPTACLTRMERIVLRQVLAGRTSRQIATVLSRSPRTIEVHRRQIMRKLGAPNYASLVKQVNRAGVIDPCP